MRQACTRRTSFTLPPWPSTASATQPLLRAWRISSCSICGCQWAKARLPWKKASASARDGQCQRRRALILPGDTRPASCVALATFRALAFHPPFLYAGYVGFSMAFSFAIAALLVAQNIFAVET